MPLLWPHSYTPMGSPPWQDPPARQLTITWVARLICATAGLLRAMVMRSERAEVVPWAQQEPQYTGMCWFLFHVVKSVPLTLRQSNASGTAPGICQPVGPVTTDSTVLAATTPGRDSSWYTPVAGAAAGASQAKVALSETSASTSTTTSVSSGAMTPSLSGSGEGGLKPVGTPNWQSHSMQRLPLPLAEPRAMRKKPRASPHQVPQELRPIQYFWPFSSP
mmetsp:Transcript_20672/g.79319  ORF Transcript_20672/g.79319 Transcript_20672/m.79319 type:complete len:220 (+) Transcript_20672:704-1363(+)